MKILVLSTIDTKGGAAQLSWVLREKLKKDGHTVNTFVRYKYSNEKDVFVIPRKRWQDWLVKLFANDLTFAHTQYIFNTKEYKEADIIHCHNLHSNFFNLRQLIRMSKEKPVIWTLHDIWAITGYASDSGTRRNPNKKRFLLYLWDNTPFLLWLKKRIYKKSKLQIVTVSDWLKKEVENSILKDQSIIRIYNGVDTNTFKPVDKIEARKKLNLPLDKKIIGFNIKGHTDTNVIINDFKNRNDIHFLAIGHSHIKTDTANYQSISYINDKELLVSYFSAMDIFLYPTHGDTFGLIVAEAMACGTPAVTYSTDALPEIVEHKKTGYIAEYGNIEDLKSGINYILNLSQEEYVKMSAQAREKIITNFTIERMYKEYLTLYNLLTKHNE